MGRIRSALNILTGLSESERTGYKYVVECRPEAWRCSVCGGGLVSGPAGRPLVHMHYYGTHPSSCVGAKLPLSVRYVGPRAHLARVWASLWGNRPRVVRSEPHSSQEGSSSSALGPMDSRNQT